MAETSKRDPMQLDPSDLPHEIASESGDRKPYWSPTLEELVDVLERHFDRVRCSSDARSDAESVVAVIAEFLGGRTVYLPRSDRLRRSLRDLRILSEFNGRNFEELAQRHHVTPRRVRQIVQQHRRKD